MSHYLQKSRGGDVEKNLTLLKNILLKLQNLHGSGFAHLNLSSNNIYFNRTTNEVFLGPIHFGDYDDNELWYSSPETSFINLNLRGSKNKKSLNALNNEDLDNYFHIKNDIWSFGCIIAEMFFIATPLFQSFSERDKIRKLFEIMGIPKFEEMSSYLNVRDFNLINNTYSLKQQYKPLIYELVDYNLRSASPFRKELYEILFSCLSFNPKRRPDIQDILDRITNLEDLSFNYINKNEISYQDNYSRTNDRGIYGSNMNNKNEKVGLKTNYNMNSSLHPNNEKNEIYQYNANSLYDKFKTNLNNFSKLGIRNQPNQLKQETYSPLTINTISQTISGTNNNTTRRNFYCDAPEIEQNENYDDQSREMKRNVGFSRPTALKEMINNEENEEYKNLNSSKQYYIINYFRP